MSQLKQTLVIGFNQAQDLHVILLKYYQRLHKVKIYELKHTLMINFIKHEAYMLPY